MEKVDIYDKNRIKTGETMIRGEKRDGGYLHIVVHICVINSEGKMLIQKRQASKKTWSGMWDLSAGGMAVAGEDSCTAAERELFEELGIKIDFSDKRPCFTVNFLHGFDDYYIINMDADISSLSLQQEEVAEADWADYNKICGMIDDGSFIPYHKSLVKLIYDMRYGADARNLDHLHKLR